MAAVLALTVVPVILLAFLAVAGAVTEGSITGVLTAAVFIVVLLGCAIRLFRWAQEVDHASDSDHASETT